MILAIDRDGCWWDTVGGSIAPQEFGREGDSYETARSYRPEKSCHKTEGSKRSEETVVAAAGIGFGGGGRA